MHVFNDKQYLLTLLEEGATVITPNNRLCESLIQYYFSHHLNKTMDKPVCLPYNLFLIKAYEQINFINPHTPRPIVLNRAQCQHLWHNLIKSQIEITYSEGLLESVMSAWERCEQWQITSEHSEFHYTPQTRQFQKWWQLFNKQLIKNHLITEYQLVSYLIQEERILFSQPVVWVCFDEFNPQQIQLQQHLQKQGIKQYQYDLKERTSKPNLLAAQDDKEESQQLIAWLHLKLKEGNQRIGVVVPDLSKNVQALKRTLTQHFDPELFDLTLGQTLDEFPLVAHALCWLNLDTQFITAYEAALLLQSPYLGSAQEEFLLRSEYLQEESLLENQTISLSTFIQNLNTSAPKLANLLEQIKPFPKQATIHDWIEHFQARLNSLGFPGEMGLNSENYQCFNRMMLLFDEFRQLSLLTPTLTQANALELLNLLAKNTIFQAQKINPRIQISGLLEASGCEFECLWVMGLTNECLPKKVHLSAFIPPQLQRTLHMPHSQPARELHLAKQSLQRLLNSAPHVVFSYPKLKGDSPNLPSPLITQHLNFELLPMNDRVVQAQELISLNESYTLPIKDEECVHGGTAILANQAKCPFKSFAEHRLSAQSISSTTDGLNAKARGKIIHKVMELLWQILEHQEKLLTLDQETLEEYITQAINKALAPVKQQYPQLFSPLLQDIEYIRLKRLTFDYLQWEKQRPPFTIAALEQSYDLNLAGLNFQVRVDRLDQVGHNKWVIDYKSTLPSSKPWNENRPKEPQLLLYALLDKHINTLLLMQLKTGKVNCSGLSEENQGISGINTLKKDETWENLRAHWRTQLTVLAQEFQQGHCPPQPAQLTLCQHCDYQNLCRFQANE
jgi:ATP-dependent helicase/nuclease subunit B